MDWTAIIETDKQLLLHLNGSDSLFLDGLAKTLTMAALWVPLYGALFYLVLKNNNSMQKVLLVLACAGLCVFLAGSLDDMIVKPLVARWRPARDPDIGMLTDIVNGYRGGRFGFFSAHASNTFSIAMFFTLLVRNKVLSVALILWSLVNCWTRMYLGVHYPGDIVCGLLWGGLVGTGVWLLHSWISQRFFTRNNFISTHYTSTGYQLSHVNVVITVLVLTVIYAIIRACFFLYI